MEKIRRQPQNEKRGERQFAVTPPSAIGATLLEPLQWERA
jgi:hypothetical protein